MSQVKQITPVGVVPKAWVKSTLESVSEFITKGSTPTTFGFDWVESGIPFLRSECVTDNGFNMKGLSYISNEAHEYMVRSKIVAGDILISITGNVGRIAIFPKELVEGNINQHIARVRINEPNECDEGFVYYQINQVLYRQYYYGIVTGAAYPQLSLKQIRETPIYLPPLPTQKRIASILTAYDDLIENNLKRIKLLEEIAQRTYEEWFVKFRVNGEQLAIDENTGLPVGWKELPLGDLISFHKGKKASVIVDGYQNGFEKLLLLDGIESGKYPYTSPIGQVIAERNDLIMLMDGARSSKVFFADRGVVGSTLSKIVIKNSNLSSSLLKHFFEINFGMMQTNNTGAAIPHANKNFINSMPFSIPTLDVFIKWKTTIDPIYNQIQNLKDQILLLKQSRDILLPRLMSGTINVES